MRKIILLLILISNNFVFAQNIVYDVRNNTFTLNGAIVNDESLLIKKTNYQVALQNFNPFLYNCETTITAKDNIKDFFEFVTRLGKVTVEDVRSMSKDNMTIGIQSTRNVGFSTLVDTFLNNYEEAYLISQDLKSSHFDYLDFNRRLVLVNHNNLLTNYRTIKSQLNSTLQTGEDLDDIIKKLGLPTLVDVEKMYELMNQLNDVLVIYNANSGTYPTNNFNSGLNSKITLELKLKYKDDKDAGIKNTKIFYIKSNISVNFSSGIFMAWNPKKIYNSTLNATNKYRIEIESERDYLPGVSILGHLLLPSLQNSGFVIGAGLDIEATPNFLLGVCYKFINSNIILSSGVGFSHQDKLSDALKENIEYDAKPELTYKKILESGFWIGVSYKI